MGDVETTEVLREKATLRAARAARASLEFSWGARAVASSGVFFQHPFRGRFSVAETRPTVGKHRRLAEKKSPKTTALLRPVLAAQSC